MRLLQTSVVECKAANNAGIAQLVERNLAKVEVESSRLFSRSRFREKGKQPLPFFVEAKVWRGSKAVMPRIANPVSPVRLRTAPPVKLSGSPAWMQHSEHAGLAQLVERYLAKV